jgi:hypothetical protein
MKIITAMIQPFMPNEAPIAFETIEAFPGVNTPSHSQ